MMMGPFRADGSLVAALSILAMLAASSWAEPKPSGNPGLVIVIEGLRPESFTPSLMPNLHSLSKRGVTFNNHHAVFPIVTVVNAASITTGAYPSTHGLLGNTIFLPEFNANAQLDTREIRTLERIQDATGGRLLTAPSLAAILGTRNKKLLVISSGAPATAFILNPEQQGGGTIHPDFTRPESLANDVTATLGPAPQDESAHGARDAWAVDAYLDVGLAQIKPDLAILWLAGPARSQAEAGLDPARNIEAIRNVDVQVGRVLQRHKKLRLRVNVFITSDRGISTRTGGDDLSRFLVTEGLKAGQNSQDVVVLDNASIFVEDRDRTRIREIVQRLQRWDWVGAIYTQQARRTHPESFVPGALSFQAVYMDHERAPDILVEPARSNDRIEQDYPGATRGYGKAGSGSSSPSDLRTLLVAGGPDIKRGAKSMVPTAHFDLAPTLCFLLGIEPPTTMDGRVLVEALRGGPKPESLEVLRRRHGSETTWDGGGYRLIMTELSVDGVDYLDFTKVERIRVR